MKRIISVLLLLFMVSAMLPIQATATTFSDVPESHWAYDTICGLTEKGIINGVGDGLYQPDGTLTRAQFIKLLTCALGTYDAQKTYPVVFADTPSDAWYTPYVTCGVQSGIIENKGDTFMPENSVSRGTAAVWIANGLGIMTDTECPFSDVLYAQEREAVAAAAERGLIKGYEDGTYRPGNTLTRAEAATLIERLIRVKEARSELRTDAANEIVFAEKVQVAETGSNKNQVTAMNAEHKTLTIASADNVVKNLKTGDVLYIPDAFSDGEDVLVKVVNSKKSGTKTVISYEEPGLSDVIESIDISTIVTPSAADLAKNEHINAAGGFSGGDVGKVDLGLEKKDGKWTVMLNADEHKKKEFSIETPSFKDKKGAYAKMNMSMEVLVDIQMNLLQPNLEAKTQVLTEISSVVGYANDASANGSIPFPEITIAVAGPLEIAVTPSITASAGGEFKAEANAILTNDSGIEYTDGALLPWSTTGFDSELAADAEGYAEIGVSAQVDLGLLDIKHIGDLDLLTLTADLGVGIEGSSSIEQSLSGDADGLQYAGHQNTPDANGRIHNCYFCVEGTIYSYDFFTFGLSEELNEGLKEYTGKELTYKSKKHIFVFSPWHYSFGDWEGEHFEMKNCPHMAYETTITVRDKETKQPLAGASVYVNDKKNGVTDANGQIVFYLEPNLYSAKLNMEGYTEDTISFYVPWSRSAVSAELESDLKGYKVTVTTPRSVSSGKKYSITIKGFKNGKQVWSYKTENLGALYAIYASKPYIHKDKVYFTYGRSDEYAGQTMKLCALNLRTGEEVWKIPMNAGNTCTYIKQMWFDEAGNIHILSDGSVMYNRVSKDGVMLNQVYLGAMIYDDYSVSDNVLYVRYESGTDIDSVTYASTIDMATGAVIHTVRK